MLDPSEQELLELSNRIHALPAWESEQMLFLYQEYIRKVLAADSVNWLAAYSGSFGQECWRTELLNGWKVTDIVYDSHAPDMSQSHYYHHARENGNDPLTELALNTVGKTRVLYIDVDSLTSSTSKSGQKKYSKQVGISHRMLGVYHLSDQAESYVMVDRFLDGKPYTQEDKESLYRLLLSFPRVHHWLCLKRGLISPAQRPVTPRVQEVLMLLQQNLSEAEIAEHCELSPTTVHSYVMELYKIFNVSSRAELMSLWFQEIPTIS
jgi:DNA-binding CsgD family transcriptional regulator